MDAVVDLPSPNVQLTRFHALNGETDSGEYPGFDRFGRVKRQMWVDGAFGPHGSNSAVPNIPPVVSIGYAYDKASNRTQADDIRPGAKRSDRHTDYLYDGLHRLAEAKRGVRNGGFTHSPLDRSQKWTLDKLGNWGSLGRWNSSLTTPAYDEQTRTHNKVNELGRVSDGGKDWPSLQ